MSTNNTTIAVAVAASAVALGVGYVLGTRIEANKHWNDEPKICDTILDHVGNTPLVRINRIAKEEGVDCEILCKCEFFNAGGSVKDRIGKRMVMDAEKEGRIKKGDVLIEPTSGNTGIGLALASAVLGYKMVISLPKKMSDEKVNVLKALGAIVKRTPTDAPCVPDKDVRNGIDGQPYSHIGKANKIMNELNQAKPGQAHILDQYANKSNPLAHIEGTAAELLRQCDGKIDAVVVSAGTGGTIAGIAYKLKKHLPNVKVIGVDPYGSILAETGANKIINNSNGDSHVYPGDTSFPANEQNKGKAEFGYQVEGIGYDFIPEVLEGVPGVNRADGQEKGKSSKLIDYWVKTQDREGFMMARRLMRSEGLLCGGSCGTAMAGAIIACKHFKWGKDKRVVVLLADSTRNYMTKFLKDEWMEKYGFTPTADEPQYTPHDDLATLAKQSKELCDLNCKDTWVEQHAYESSK